jgi:hypothetical protein
VSAPTTGKISKSDIEQRLRNLQGGVEERITSQRQKIVTAVIAAAVLTVLLSFLLGRRAGRKKNTVVEIRRF